MTFYSSFSPENIQNLHSNLDHSYIPMHITGSMDRKGKWPLQLNWPGPSATYYSVGHLSWKVKSLNPKLVTSNGYDVYERNILPWKRNKFAFQFGPVRHPQAHHWKDGKKPQLQSSRTFSNVYFGKVWPLLKPLNPKLVTSNGYNVPTVDYSLNLHSNLLGYSCLCDFEARSTHCGKENELSTCVLRALT